MTDKRICLTTCDSDEAAENLAQALVEQRLAACVNVLPGVRSYYRWKGKIESDSERLLLMKTTAGRVDSLRAAVLELHSYETPEFVVIAVEDGSAAYLEWIAANVRYEET